LDPAAANASFDPYNVSEPFEIKTTMPWFHEEVTESLDVKLPPSVVTLYEAARPM
jgi:hypothetical protein